MRPFNHYFCKFVYEFFEKTPFYQFLVLSTPKLTSFIQKPKARILVQSKQPAPIVSTVRSKRYWFHLTIKSGASTTLDTVLLAWDPCLLIPLFLDSLTFAPKKGRILWTHMTICEVRCFVGSLFEKLIENNAYCLSWF